MYRYLYALFPELTPKIAIGTVSVYYHIILFQSRVFTVLKISISGCVNIFNRRLKEKSIYWVWEEISHSLSVSITSNKVS